MPEILLFGVDSEIQKEFYENKFHDFLGCAVFGFLFEGLTMRGIERKYLDLDKLDAEKYEKFHGHFAMAVLNLMGIETCRSTEERINPNSGIYRGRNVLDVAMELLASSNPQSNIIGRALCDFAARHRSG